MEFRVRNSNRCDVIVPNNAKNIVKVILPRRIWVSYDYRVPTGVVTPTVGARVSVPLGNSRAVGLVIEHVDQSIHQLKPIERVIDEQPLVSREVIELGKWMSEYYHYPLGSVFETILPRLATRGVPAKIEPEQQWHLVAPATTPKFKSNAKRQRRTWEELRTRDVVQESQLKELNIDKVVLDAMERNGVVVRSNVEPDLKISPSPLAPTREQLHAIDAIKASLDEFNTFLLDGITGSGKTEVYLQVIDETLRRGQQALVLVPEIALTPQITNRFRERFNRIAIMHSMIPQNKRFAAWAQAATGQMPIIVGTRSAVFTPFDRLGVIVVDEEHDPSYKQSESLRYSARDIAVMRASKLNIPCILGSATPSIETIVNARAKRYRYLRLSRRPGTARLPTFHVQDIRDTRLHGGICEPLLRRIGQHLENKSQVLVLINRRGYATQFRCTACGWTAFCSDCDVKLTWHETPQKILHCHACGRRYEPLQQCPDCSKATITMFGVGTQQVEETLAAQFPNIAHYRIDRDNIRTNLQFTKMFEELQQAHYGLLIGTQMLAKGHHFPNVTLVAVIAADNGFLSSDFRGPERAAQLIVQVAGRAGREEKRGEVWIQSYDPENPDLKSLVKDGYEGFTNTELVLRKEAKLPPFGQMAVIRVEGKDEGAAEDFCVEVLNVIRQCDVTVRGPATAPISRVAKQYRFQGIVLSLNRRVLHDALKTIERMRPKSNKTRWSIDVDPSEMA